MSPKALLLFTLVCQKVSGSGQCKTGHGRLCAGGGQTRLKTAMSHITRSCHPFPFPFIYAEVRAQDFWADDVQLCRCNVTALMYITALPNSISVQSRRWTWVAMGGNGFGTVTWDNLSSSTALGTGTLLTDEPTSPFLRYSLTGHAILFLFQTVCPLTQA